MISNNRKYQDIKLLKKNSGSFKDLCLVNHSIQYLISLYQKGDFIPGPGQFAIVSNQSKKKN
jgi:hypothetical protein